VRLFFLFAALFTALLTASPARAEERLKVWIALRDKGPVSPGAGGLSGRAYEDAPVHAPCLQALRDAGVEIAVVLKWQNRVSGWVDAAGRGTVEGLPCVQGVEEMPRKIPVARPEGGEEAPGLAKRASPDAAPSASASAATASFGIFDSLFVKTGAAALRDTLTARGLAAGAGLRIALMDADFSLGHRVFDSLFAADRILDQRDFVSGAPVAATRQFGSSHGATVLSLIAADWPGRMEGLAPKAGFLLYRTEDAVGEEYAEEDFLAAALERAVDSGAQVINISLGYRYDFDSGPNYPYAQMNGRTRPSTLAALGAARRGALVVVAIGNEGLSRFGEPTLTAPADADSIVTVGMVDASTARCSYSSTGPSFDGRLKPEISSLGCTIRVPNTGTDTGARNEAGTSVGAPVIAGIAALLRQLHPDSAGGAFAKSAQDIRAALMTTGSRAQASNNQVGKGLVRAAEAHCALALDGPCSQPPPPSLAVKGVLVWRGGTVKTLPWPTPLDVSRARMWDLQGRAHKVRGGWDAEGDLQILSDRRLAPGSYILRVPALPDSSSP
jgi:serine protease AprX